MAIKKVVPDVHDRVDNRYYIVLHNPAGGQYKKIIRGKRAAEAHHAEQKARLMGGGSASTADRQVTVRQFMHRIQEAKAQELSWNTRQLYQGLLDHHIYPAIGDRKVASLATDYLTLRELFAHVQNNTGIPSRRQVEQLVREMLRIAVRQGVLARNPLDGIPWQKLIPTRGEVYQPEWLDILRVRDDVIKQTTKTIAGTTEMTLAELDILCGSGVRISELMGLSPEDIDIAAGTLTVRRQLLRLSGKGFIFAPPKTKDSGPRTIPVPKFVLASLAATQLRNGTRTFTLPWKDITGPPRTHELYFFSLQRRDRPAGASSFSQRMSRIGERLALPGDLHAHCYRHRYTTTLHDAGVPQIVIDLVTGHLPTGSISLTTYTKATKKSLAKVPVAIDDAWREARAESVTGSHSASS